MANQGEEQVEWSPEMPITKFVPDWGIRIAPFLNLITTYGSKNCFTKARFTYSRSKEDFENV
ncbi:hypothetical protein BpHYR1_024987 [Brachionus plicatilis]|uniref:Uncharacterized protein n=1 Tax=Brachionus plicatilis TaxID=10195 RepID=A0A3M7RVN7_BRAPC|nr:hypothetical protein BpHYR1_024987 [Brachionus plicatilis]